MTWKSKSKTKSPHFVNSAKELLSKQFSNLTDDNGGYSEQNFVLFASKSACWPTSLPAQPILESNLDLLACFTPPCLPFLPALHVY